jgi:hypothetical protein
LLVVLPPPPLLIAATPGDAACCCQARPDDDNDGRARDVRWRLQRKEPGWFVGEQRQASLFALHLAPASEADGFAMA